MSAKKDESELTEEDIYQEHQKAVNPTAHWVYLFAVLIGGVVAMIGLIALMGAS